MNKYKFWNVLFKLFPIRFGLFIINLLVMTNVFAQSDDYKSVDSLTTDSYFRKDWSTLNKTGKLALQSGIDYYYLRMRLGIASYEQRNYAIAEKHFRKALLFNQYDVNAQSYLAGSLLESFRLTEAGHVFNRSTPTAKQFIPIRKGFRLSAIHSDFGMITRNGNRALQFKTLAGESAVYGQQRVYGGSRIFDAGAFLQLRPNLMYYIGYQLIDTKVTDRFAYIETFMKRDSTAVFDWGSAHYYEVDTLQKTIDFEHLINQKSVYMQAQWSPSSRLSLTAGGQLIRIRQTNTYAEQSTYQAIDTAYYITATDSVAMFTLDLNRMVFQQDTTTHLDWATSIKANYTFGKLEALAGFNFSSLNGNKIKQYTLGFCYLPFGNKDLYNQTEVIALDNSSTTNIILKEIVGIKLLSPVWFEIRLLMGNIDRYSDQGAYIVYNSPELVHLRIEPTIFVIVSKHLWLQLSYKYQKAESFYYSAIPNLTQLSENSINNQSYSIIGGIKWIM